MKANNHEKYDGLELKWEQGHNPELHVGTDVTDLNGMSDDALEKLLKDKGFEEL